MAEPKKRGDFFKYGTVYRKTVKAGRLAFVLFAGYQHLSDSLFTFH